MTTKHQVIQLIVDLSQDNEQMTKSILGKSVVEGAKKALDSTHDLPVLKTIAESILFIAKCIEDLQQELREMKAHNEKAGVMFVHRDQDIQGVERLINKYYESLNKVIREI